MIFKINSTYKISIKIGTAVLTYTCAISAEDEIFFTFKDKFGEEITYNKNLILSVKEVLE
jgi:hypothetical protein